MVNQGSAGIAKVYLGSGSPRLRLAGASSAEASAESLEVCGRARELAAGADAGGGAAAGTAGGSRRGGSAAWNSGPTRICRLRSVTLKRGMGRVGVGRERQCVEAMCGGTAVSSAANLHVRVWAGRPGLVIVRVAEIHALAAGGEVSVAVAVAGRRRVLVVVVTMVFCGVGIVPWGMGV